MTALDSLPTDYLHMILEELFYKFDYLLNMALVSRFLL